MNISKQPLIIIMGPTGVGKSDFALSLAQQCKGEIINCDVGQFYTPLSIGTAKPDWHNAPVPHHLFDIISEPKNFSVTEYRARASSLITEIRARGNLPIIVGGSGFYVNALFFPPLEEKTYPDASFDYAQDDRNSLMLSGVETCTRTTDTTWDRLNAIDPVRAQQIHPHDKYRIERALQIWEQTGIVPSAIKPVYQPVSDNFIIVHVERERKELYARINERTKEMLAHGWIEEVQAIPTWYPFLLKKGLIGYPDIINYLTQLEQDIAALTSSIQQATRHYAKRQMTFWRMLAGKLQHAHSGGKIVQVNLTLSPVDLYLRQLLENISGKV